MAVRSVAQVASPTAFDGRAYARLLTRVAVHRHSAARDLAQMRETGRGVVARALSLRRFHWESQDNEGR